MSAIRRGESALGFLSRLLLDSLFRMENIKIQGPPRSFYILRNENFLIAEKHPASKEMFYIFCTDFNTVAGVRDNGLRSLATTNN